MRLRFSEEFKDDFKKIKDNALKLKIAKHLKKLEILPESGKPLQHNLKGYRSIRIPPFRIIYRLEGDKLMVNCFEHRKDVYKA
ncbi:MAG: type II toxin-antitoxin system RelE/ParE family toxin [Candidatus Woesearchaeota archaeon]